MGRVQRMTAARRPPKRRQMAMLHIGHVSWTIQHGDGRRVLHVGVYRSNGERVLQDDSDNPILDLQRQSGNVSAAALSTAATPQKGCHCSMTAATAVSAAATTAVTLVVAEARQQRNSAGFGNSEHDAASATVTTSLVPACGKLQ
jgi:hypothetical protein